LTDGILFMPSIVFYKPYGILSQFTRKDGHSSLCSFGFPKGVYPAGRLDADSEGLLLLTSDGKLQAHISEPKYKMPKVYWAQVERAITPEAIRKLREGPVLKDGPTKPCLAKEIPDPGLAPRVPPVRFRKTVPTSWVEVVLREGRNRQVRRMLAAVGFPVLRLLRRSIGPIGCDNMKEGEWRELSPEEVEALWTKIF